MRTTSLLSLCVFLLTGAAFSHEAKPAFAGASEEAAQIMKKFKLPPGLTVDLWAAEPMLAHPVALCVDEKGRVFVSQTFRFSDGISGGGEKDFGALDLRGHMDWLEQDLSNRTVEDRVAMLKRNLGDKISLLQRNPERVQLIEDRDGDGKADYSSVFREDFNDIPDGAAEGILAYKGNVYFTNIPHLWLLRDEDGDGKAEIRKSLAYGFGPRIAFLGHDLHGLIVGPDRKLYYSVGDRGYHVEQNGKIWHGHEWGAVFRSELDGSNFEVFCTGLRNPQELAFDESGNLWTADNNADKGDPARWVYLVEGGDSGWRGGYQFVTWPNNLGAWMSEDMCRPLKDAKGPRPAYVVPPVGAIGAGPSGLCFYPGTGLDDAYKGHFFECDFRGESGGVWDLSNEPWGAGFKMLPAKQFCWNVQATDICFAPDGSLLASVWVGGIQKGGKGRIYKIKDPKFEKDPAVLEVKKLLAEGLEKQPVDVLIKLLGHKDQRIRQEAQFALADQGDSKPFIAALSGEPLARLHAIWGLGLLARKSPAGFETILVPLLKNTDAEVRAQTLRVLGEASIVAAQGDVTRALKDESLRVQSFAAMALAKLGAKDALPAVRAMLAADATQDAWLRQSAIFAFEKLGDEAALLALLKDGNVQVRLAACVALRRHEKPSLAAALNDTDVLVIQEAARAIAEIPIAGALPALANLIGKTSDERTLMRVISAHNKLGKPENAMALAELAAKNETPEKPRTLALRLLQKWAKPEARDPLNGLYRPLAERDGNAAANALRAQVAALLKSTGMVKEAVCDVVEAYKVGEAGAGLFADATDEAQTAAPRVRALKALSVLGDAKVSEAVEIALKSKNELVRKEAQRIQAQLKPNEGAAVLAAILGKPESSLPEKQGALQTLAGLKDAKADELAGEWLKKLNAGQAAPELHLEILEAAAGRAALKDAIDAYQKNLKAEDTIRDYRDTLVGGDAAAGKKIFMEKTEAQCMRCHRIGSEGGEAGPQLGDIGKRTSRDYILESIVAPNHKIAAGFETLIIKLTDGKTHVGVKKGETETEIELLCPPDTRVKLPKAKIASTKTGPSSMPEDLAKLLTKRDLRNLVEYLVAQR